MIRKSKSKSGTRYYVYIPRTGTDKDYVGAYGSEKAAIAAEQEAMVTARKIRAGELPAEMSLDRTFAEAAHAWIDHLEQSESRSYRSFRSVTLRHLIPAFGGTPIVNIKRAHITTFRDRQARTAKPRTVNTRLIVLACALAHFVSSGWLESSPYVRITPVAVPRERYNWIRTREEMTRLLAACTEEYRDLIALALATGMRFDELLHLQWADVDLERREIDVHRGKHGTTKTGEPRTVPILDVVLPMLRARALKRDGALLVFPSPLGGVRAQAGVRIAFYKARDAAKLDKDLTFHDLRHTFATHWVRNGGDIFRLSKILGHSSVTVTETTYAHHTPDVFTQDYGRLQFTIPDARRPPLNIAIAGARDARGRILRPV